MALGVIVMVTAGGFVFLWSGSQAIGIRREVAQQAAQAYCQKAHDEHCEALITGVRSASADEDSVDVAVWQIWLNIAGLVGLGATVVYARRAWLAAQVSAKAATTALDHTKADSAEQSGRFRQQLKIAKDSVEAARAAIVTTDRAWLTLDVKLSGPLIFKADEVRVKVLCTCQNIGRSPATRIVWDVGVYGSAGEAHQAVSDNTRHTHIGIVPGLGDVMFPSPPDKRQIPLSMSRAKFIESCERLANDPNWGAARSHPSIIIGVWYALPGDNRRRFTYKAFFIAHKRGGIGDFDGSEGRFELSELKLAPDGIHVPIT